MKYLAFIGLLFIGSSVYAQNIKYGDYVLVEDDFYGTFCGVVIARTEGVGGYVYTIMSGLTSLNVSERKITKIINKKECNGVIS